MIPIQNTSIVGLFLNESYPENARIKLIQTKWQFFNE